MSVEETSIWGDWRNCRNINEIKRLMKKQDLLGCYPFVDHVIRYAYKPRGRRGSAKENRTFLVSFAYNYDAFADEAAFIAKVNDAGLLFYKQSCVFRGKNAYKIFIYEPDLPINSLIQLT
jgi:hypothetical protein